MFEVIYKLMKENRNSLNLIQLHFSDECLIICFYAFEDL